MQPDFKSLEDNDTAISLPNNMFKREELMKFVLEAFKTEGLNRLGKIIWDKGRGKIPLEENHYRESWLTNGVECEVLSPKSLGWRKGKIRFKLSLEFCPNDEDSIVSELDSLRQSQEI
jgi:KGK domain